MSTLQQHWSHSMLTPVPNLPCTRARQKGRKNEEAECQNPASFAKHYVMCPRTRLLQSKVEDTCCSAATSTKSISSSQASEKAELQTLHRKQERQPAKFTQDRGTGRTTWPVQETTSPLAKLLVQASNLPRFKKMSSIDNRRHNFCLEQLATKARLHLAILSRTHDLVASAMRAYATCAMPRRSPKKKGPPQVRVQSHTRQQRAFKHETKISRP